MNREELFNKWAKWFANHPHHPKINLDGLVTPQYIAVMLGYRVSTVNQYTYRYRRKKENPEEHILYIKNKINPNKKGNAKYEIRLRDVIDFIVEQDMRDRFYDISSD